MLEPVAVGILEVDHDDVRRDLGDAPAGLVRGVDDRNPGMPGLAQAILDDGGARSDSHR